MERVDFRQSFSVTDSQNRNVIHSAEEHTERLPTKRHEREEEEKELVHKAKCRQSASVVFGGDTQGQNHEEMRTALREELKKAKPSKPIIKRLLDGTAMGRIQWINTEPPMVADILAEYPPLSTGKMVGFMHSNLQTLQLHKLYVCIHSICVCSTAAQRAPKTCRA